VRYRSLISATACALFVAGVASGGCGAWIHLKAGLAQVLLHRAWADTQREGKGTEVRPWPWADTWPVARMRVPAHDVDVIVLAGGSGRTIAFGPGHLDDSVDPGTTGNCVLAGHRDTHFSFLKELREGDRVLIESAAGEVVSYAFRDAMVVDEDQLWVLADTDECRLTLVTCYPFDDPIPGGPLRFVVRADAVSNCRSDWLTYSPVGRSGRGSVPRSRQEGLRQGA